MRRREDRDRESTLPARLDVAALTAEIEARLGTLPTLATARVRVLRREFSTRIAQAPPVDVVALANSLLAVPGAGRRMVAYELVLHHKAALASLGTREVERLGHRLDSWGAVDMFACYLSGPAWRERQVPDKLIHGWARSPNRWWRRAALVSTVPLNNRTRGGNGDKRRTLVVCRLLVDDRDDMVVKAMSWALRELAKRDPEAVHTFVSQHEKRLAPRVLREVRNKLTTGLKNP